MKSLATLILAAAAAFAQNALEVIVGRPIQQSSCVPAGGATCGPVVVLSVVDPASDSIAAFEVTAKYLDSFGHTFLRTFIVKANSVAGKYVATTILEGEDIQFIETPTAKALVYRINRQSAHAQPR